MSAYLDCVVVRKTTFQQANS